MKTIKDLPQHSRPREKLLGANLIDAERRGAQKSGSGSSALAVPADLQALHHEPAPKAQARRRRFFESSAGLLQAVERRK
jgi:hypothetical protein